MSYCATFRKKVLKYVKEGNSQAKAREKFDLGQNTITRWIKLEQETGELENRKLNRKNRKIDAEKLRKDVEEHPDDFNVERAKRFGCSEEGMRKALKREKLTLKKKTVEYAERSEAERAAYEEEIVEIPEEKRYYVDESGVNKFMYREYGRAPRGVKVAGKVSGKKFKRTNIVAAQCKDEIVGRAEYECAMNSRLFELWFVMLLALLPEGSVIIMDRAPFHRKKVLKAMAEAAGCRVIFLPAYSPDFNPIEHVWANLKKFLKNTVHNFATLSDAIFHYFEVA